MKEKEFKVNVYTPLRLQLSETVDAITCRGLDGELGILKNHMPCVIALDLGVLKLKKDGQWKEYLCSEGFLEVYQNRADIYVDYCREEADLAAALTEADRQRRRDTRSVREHWKNEIHLARIVADMKNAKPESGYTVPNGKNGVV